MNLLDVTGSGKYLVNLDLVRLVKVEPRGEKAEITFVYADDHESIFAVPSGRFAVLAETFQELGVAA
jgi:hypothetical protein